MANVMDSVYRVGLTTLERTVCRARAARFGFARVEMVPVENGVEGQEEGALGLPAPERAEGEDDDVAFAERDIGEQDAVG